jgi:hypothetical protein
VKSVVSFPPDVDPIDVLSTGVYASHCHVHVCYVVQTAEGAQSIKRVVYSHHSSYSIYMRFLAVVILSGAVLPTHSRLQAVRVAEEDVKAESEGLKFT